MRFAEQVVVVTGAGRGIGQETARQFAAEGAAVLIADIDLGSARGVAAEIVDQGGSAWAVQVDVADASSVATMIAEAVERFGRLDILVNNAAIGSNVPFVAMPLEEWQRNLDVNLTSVFLCSQAAARVMIEQGGGRIVNLASISGQRGGRGRAAYGAAKAGVILLTKVLAVELASHGIRVNAVSPGPVDTDQSRGTHTPATRRAYHDRLPVRRYGERSEVAAAILFLASDEASFIQGHIFNVDGGFNAAGLMFSDEEDTTACPSDPPAPAVDREPTPWPT